MTNTPTVRIERLGTTLWKVAVPTAAMSTLLPKALAGPFQSQIKASFDEAVGYGVGIACGFDWLLVDATGRLSAEDCAALLQANRDALKESGA